jgi:hypothetical protein
MDETNIQKAWIARIAKEERAHDKYRKRARKVEKIFRAKDGACVPLYWSVVNVQHVGVYSNQPVPDVRCRNQDANPLYAQISRIIQRGLAYCVDHPSFDASMHRVVDDYLSVALGWPRVKIDSIIKTNQRRVPIYAKQMNPMTMRPEQVQIGERTETDEEVGDQTIRWEYVPWQRFGWEPGNSWKHCDWIYIRHPMTAIQARKRFGKTVKGSKTDEEASFDSWKSKTIDIFEIWDRNKKRVLFLAKGEAEPLEIHDDPLELVDFFPGPAPLMLNVESEEMVPQPDYDYIEEYDRELNRLQERRSDLLENIRASGAFDPALPELKDMMENEDSTYVPIDNLMARIQAAGGADGIIYHLPLAEKSAVLQELNNNIQLVRAQVDDILGISDIIRGTTQQYETAAAQEIKGRWVGVRLTRKREAVIFTVKEMLRIMAQLIASHITPENLQRMTQMQITEEMMQVMQNDMMMEFLIDIETDSTVAKDEFQEKQTFQEMLNGVAQWSQSVLPMVQQNVLPSDAASGILKAALKPYAKYDKALDDALAQLPTSQAQLQELNGQLQQITQEKDQNAQQLQFWQAEAQRLQQAATEAKAAKEQADAMLKQAQAAKTQAQVPTEEAEQAETMANTQLLRAKTAKEQADTLETLKGEKNETVQ